MNQLINKYYQNKKRNNYVIYTVLFIIIGIIIFSVFYVNHKSFICGVYGSADGFDQHYTFLVYFGKYLREILYNLFINHQLVIPMWDYSMGYGSDIMTTLHYYVFGDPLTLTSVFVPEQYTEYLYDILILFRYYLCGITFICYCHFRNKESWPTIIGSLMYTFCGFAIVAGVRHPYFLNPMIYLPLLLIGIEKIYQRQSPLLFIIMIFISAVSSFYFFYMLCILIFIYAVFRFFAYYNNNYIKNVFNELKRFILYYLLGVGLAAIMLIPVIILFFNTSRSSADTYVPLTYSIYNYGSFVLNMFNHENNAGSWTYTGFSVIAFFCLLYLFISKKKNYRLIIGFILLTIFAFIPFIGSVFNGFSYVTNRWIFAYAMLVSYIVVETLPQLIQANRIQLLIMSIVYIAYVALNYIVYIALGYQSLYDDAFTFIISLVLMGMILLLLVLRSIKKLSRQLTIITISLCSIISITVNGFLKYSTVGNSYIDHFMTADIAYDTLTDYYSDALEVIDDDNFYRYDKYGSNSFKNLSLISETYTLSFYYSMTNGYVSDYLLDLNNTNMTSFQCSGVGYREQLMTLASTKYYIVEQDKNAIIPYGFEYLKSTDDYDIYYNSNYLPLGYTYDQYITRDQYDQLSVLEKQDVLLNSILVENDIDLNNHYDNDSVITTLYALSDEYLKIDDSNQTMEINIHLDTNQDVYLSLSNFEYLNDSNLVYYTNIGVDINNVHQSVRINKENYVYFNGNKDYMAYLGYYDAGDYTITLTFKDKGDYSYDAIQVLGQTTDQINEDVNNLKEDVLTNEYLGINYVSGDIELDENKFLCLTIPYSSGWKAYVDGEEVTLERANSMYMGIMLEAGSHHIELKYTTPGLKIGAMISCANLGILVIYMRKRKVPKNEKNK